MRSRDSAQRPSPRHARARRALLSPRTPKFWSSLNFKRPRTASDRRGACESSLPHRRYRRERLPQRAAGTRRGFRGSTSRRRADRAPAKPRCGARGCTACRSRHFGSSEIPLPCLTNDDVADLLQIAQAGILRLLRHRGLLADDTVNADEAFADAEPGLARELHGGSALEEALNGRAAVALIGPSRSARRP